MLANVFHLYPYPFTLMFALLTLLRIVLLGIPFKHEALRRFYTRHSIRQGGLLPLHAKPGFNRERNAFNVR